jgi:hypothetical protein
VLLFGVNLVGFFLFVVLALFARCVGPTFPSIGHRLFLLRNAYEAVQP